MSDLKQNTLSSSSGLTIDLFESLFHTYYSSLVVYATHLTGETTVSEDIVCDIFTSIWEKKAILPTDNTNAYLFSAVRNRSLNYLAQLKVRNNYQEKIFQKGDVIGMLTWEYYVEAELREHIEQAIRKLPSQCQKIFIMNRFDNKSVTEIAQTLQLSPRTVEKQISIAIRKLRIKLADYLPLTYLAFLFHD